MTQGRDEPVRFLIIDDDEISVMAIQRCMTQLNMENPVTFANNGAEALDILQAAIDENGALPPIVVTTDMNMPHMGGIEFLDEVRRHPILNTLVVFVLTTADAPEDIAAAYDRNVAGYIVKDSPIETLKKTLTLLKHYSDLMVLPS